MGPRRARRALAAVALGACLLSAPGMAAEGAERYDHQGSACAVLSPGAAWAASSSSAAVPAMGARWSALLGGGLAIDDVGRELLLLVRASGRGTAVDAAALVGFRSYFGHERLRTFVDLQLAVPFWPMLLAGPRLGAGVQYELAPVAGAFCAASAQLGLGPAFLFAGDLFCGLQLRSYLLQ